MADREQKLTMKVEAEGAKQAADDLQKVAEAQRDIGEATKQAADQAKPAGSGDDDATKIKDTAEATEELKVEEQALKDVLNQIHPAFGGLLDAMGGATRLAGRLGTANLSLSGILDKVTGAVKGNRDAFMLLLAGGAVVAGIMAIVKALQMMAEAAEAGRKATEKLADSQTALAEKRRELREQLDDDLSRRGTATQASLDQAVRWAQVAQRKGFDEAGVQAAGLLAGTASTSEDVVAAAALIEQGKLDPTAEGALDRLKALRASPEGQAAIKQQTEFRADVSSIGADAAAALQQLSSFAVHRGITGSEIQDIGPENMILRYLEDVEGVTGEPAQQRIRLIQQIIANRQAEAAGKWKPFGGMTAEESWADRWARIMGGAVGQAEMTLQGIEAAAGAGSQPESPAAGTTVIHHHQHYGERNYNTGAGIRSGSNGRNFRERTGIG